MTEPSQLKQCIKQIIAEVSYGSGFTMNNNKIPLLQITSGKLITHGITYNIAKNSSFFKLKNIAILYIIYQIINSWFHLQKDLLFLLKSDNIWLST
jgi:hypothetical protein